MNLGDLDVHSVLYNHPQLQRSLSRYSIAASNGDLSQSEAGYASEIESITTADSVVRWCIPPQTAHLNDEKTQSEATVQTIRIATDTAAHAVTIPTAVRFDEEQIHSREVEPSQRQRMEDFDSAPPTPDTDDTPYIRFAIDQLTRDQDVKASQRPVTGTSEESYPVERIVPDEGLGYLQSVREVSGPTLIHIAPKTPKSELFIPVEPQLDSPQYPNLTFKPMILRPFSMIMLIFLCLLMAVALMFCAIYSTYHDGLVAYTDGLSSAQYFLFQFLPQILAAIILLYIEAVMSAVSRLAPFTMMASDNSRRRSNALFVGLYPRSLFWPRFDYLSSGEPLLGICSFLLWPIMFTIPLQSSLFSVIIVNGVWTWTAVQGVVWTLVTIYILSLISLIGICSYFTRRSTGLIWDPRSLADIIALLPRSNSLGEYQDTEVLASKSEFRARLAVSSERLGYWRTNASHEIFYCIGEEGAPTRRYTIQDGKAEKTSDFDIYNERHGLDLEALSPNPLRSRATNSSLLAKVYSPAIRFRHIPWFLNDTMVILWPIAAFFLLLALITVSFLPSTALRNGFQPLVPAAPNSAGFSSANFLYSFVPSLLGLLIYSGFTCLSLALNRLAPWATLSNRDGAIASESLLLEYTASRPFLTAFANKHYLIGLISLLTPLTILLPILAGGLFFPIQVLPLNIVLMLPDLPAFYVILAVLVLSFIGLGSVAASLLGTGNGAGRKRYFLPHPVTCLAEVISFIYVSEIVNDAAFKAVRSKADLRARLIGRRERTTGVYGGDEVRYSFRIFKGRDGKSHLGIERVGREDSRYGRSGSGRRAYGMSRSRFSV